METAWVERRLAAILAADVVGYSHLVEMDEGGTLSALKALRREVIDPLLAEHHGRIVKLMGDGALAEFASVVDAVTCAVALQKSVMARQEDVAPERRMVFRIGFNLGDVVVESNDLLGDGVNIAARLEQICEPGGVLISGTAYDQLQGKIDLPIEFAGEQRVKNIDRPIRTYRMKLGAALPRPRRASAVPRGWFAAAAAILLAIAGAVGWWLWPTMPTYASKPSIAVLPFDNLGGDEATTRLADGITEDIITDLARFPEFEVVARNSTAVYKGKAVDVRQVGKHLGVGYVLHRRTLHRWLRAEGLTFKVVANEVRMAIATQLLADTEIDITDIGAALEFSEPAAFTHAFRRWTGCTPSVWRALRASDDLGKGT